MRQPRTIWALCAYIFGLMGILFALLGTTFYIAGIPFNGGPNWCFIPVGTAFLLGGAVCWAKRRLKEQRIENLKATGIPVVGSIQSVRHLVWINWNKKTFVNRPGQAPRGPSNAPTVTVAGLIQLKASCHGQSRLLVFSSLLFTLIRAILLTPVWTWIQSSGSFNLLGKAKSRLYLHDLLY